MTSGGIGGSAAKISIDLPNCFQMNKTRLGIFRYDTENKTNLGVGYYRKQIGSLLTDIYL